MSMSEKLAPLAIALASGALALGAALGGQWLWAGLPLMLGGLWFIGFRQRWRPVSTGCLALTVTLAAAGVYLGLAPGTMLLGVVGGLAAWDLQSFGHSLKGVRFVEGTRNLERRHLFRLLAVTALGLLVAVVSLGIEVRLSFGLLMVTGLLLMLGMAQVIRLLRGDGA